MSDVEVKYYSNHRPIKKIELDFIRYYLPDDFKVVYKDMSYRAESRVYLVKVDYRNRKIIVGFKE